MGTACGTSGCDVAVTDEEDCDCAVAGGIGTGAVWGSRCGGGAKRGGYGFIFCGVAREAAGEKDVKIGGGVSSVRQYLQAGLIDTLHLALAPVVLGKGEPLFAGLDLSELGFSVTKHKASELATHFVLERHQ